MCVHVYYLYDAGLGFFFVYFSLQVGNGGNSDTYSWHQTLEEV